MFETSVVHARAEAIRGRVSLLTVSAFAHSAVIVGAIALSVASTEFPESAPDQYVRMPTFSTPPPLGNPNAGAPHRQQPAPPRQAPALPPAQVTAPQQIPAQIPEVGTGTAETGATDAEAGGEAGPLGQPWGVEGSLGDLDAPPSTATIAPDETIYVPGGEVKSPVLIHRVDPRYPSGWAKTRMRAVVVVRCVIDRNGRVRDPQVIVPALPPFNNAVLEAVRQWRYTPGSLRGQAVETYLELKVDFAVK